ncbi:MAG: hypothetical protein J5617_03785 [Bacilli bacterium]|nr:hypothetical protein [Bacilli bacterium]
MKLVIDIDEKDYKDFQLQAVMLNPTEPSQRAKLAIANGTPYEERKGKWIVWKDCEGKTRELTCSDCGCKRRTWVNPNYCEDCGAKMEVDE